MRSGGLLERTQCNALPPVSLVMKSFFGGLLNYATIRNVGGAEWCWGCSRLAGAVVMLGASLGTEVLAQPGSVMQIPVPAPQTSRAAVGGGGANSSQPAPVAGTGDVLAGEPLAMPGETVPVGRWSGRSGVKEVALTEMPWMGGAGYGYGVAVVAQAQYRVVVATPSDAHVDALKQVMPEAITIASGQTMQAGAFADWRRANALRRALGAYGFVVEVQGL